MERESRRGLHTMNSKYRAPLSLLIDMMDIPLRDAAIEEFGVLVSEVSQSTISKFRR